MNQGRWTRPSSGPDCKQDRYRLRPLVSIYYDRLACNTARPKIPHNKTEKIPLRGAVPSPQNEEKPDRRPVLRILSPGLFNSLMLLIFIR